MIALLAVAAAAVLAALLLLGGGGGYTVKANFQNASQLVKGNLVQVAGSQVGKIENIDLTADGQAQVTMSVSEDYAPLRRGTKAIVRQASLSGIANRYVDLTMAPHGAPAIPDGGVIEQDATTSAVDLDQLFNTFDSATRKDLKQVFAGSAKQHEGRGKEMNAGLLYLNPAMAASSRLFHELNRDTPLLERFVVSSSQLVTDLADRREDLSGLVDHLATTTTAIGNEQAALRDATVKDVEANGEKRKGAFPASAQAMRDFAPVISFLRPYTPDVVGWFDDFSHSGIYDALGAASRVGVHASAFTLANGQLSPVPPQLREAAFRAGATLNQRNRCPGSAEHRNPDGSNPWKPAEVDCDPDQVLPGK